MSRIIFSILLIIGFLSNNTFAQEILSGLPGNPVLQQKQKKQELNKYRNELKSSVIEIPEPLNLPFFDDFKQTDIYPDRRKWMDNNTYVNKQFGLLPPTWGVVTFDAADAKGNIYSNANPLQFDADYLTSKPIRLDSIFDPIARALTPADSVYLSFYYQPQGYGNDPQPQDSLVLELGTYSGNFVFSRVDSITVLVDIFNTDTIFPGDTLFSPCDINWGTRILDTLYRGDYVRLPCDSVFVPETNWKRIWASEGMTLKEFRSNSDTAFFKQVFIPIIDSMWFRNDFQFRFFNYASIANDNLQSWQSNCDFWNIDYVVLDKNRSRMDTTHKEVTFSATAPSFLLNFQSMPFYQYSFDPVSSLKTSLQMYISNLDNVNQTAQYNYWVFNDQGNFEFGWDGGSNELLPYNQNGFTQIPTFATPPVNGIFTPFGNRDSIYFDIYHILNGDQAGVGFDDTVHFRQKFYNYYAYDDGTPEFGYGLTPSGAQLAYRFTLNRRDTLRAVQMYFNKTLTGANDQFFVLTIWNDLNGQPGDIIYPPDGVSVRQRPVFTDSLFQFHTYHLDTALPVQGTFYVGWRQLESQNLNLGFDANNDASRNIFFNVTGAGWQRSIYKGALLIRPILGKKIKEDEPELKPIVKSVDLFAIIPNPSDDGLIRFDFKNYIKNKLYPESVAPDKEVLQNMQVMVYNLMGQRVYEGRYKHSVDLSYLNNGIYVVHIVDKFNNNAMSQKLWMAK
jgi:hypothetical protein